MKINVLKKGDKVISATSEFVAVHRKKGSVFFICEDLVSISINSS